MSNALGANRPDELSTAAERPSSRRWHLTGLVVGGGLLAATVLAGVRYGGEMWFTKSPPAEDFGPIAAGAEVGTPHETVASEAGGWPNLFGPTYDGVARSGDDTSPIAPWGADGPGVAWRIDCGSGYSSPILFGDRMILLHRVGDEEVVSCRNAADAATIWEHRYPTTFECTSHYTHGPYSTPATDGERVYTIGAQGQFFCLDANDGHVIWERDLDAEFGAQHDVFGVGHSPLLVGDRVILNVGGTPSGTGVVAFDKRTGELSWQAVDHMGASYATPQPARIHGRDFVFVLTAVGLVSLDPHDGTVHWSIPYATEVVDNYNAVTPVVHGDLVFVSVYGQGAMCLRILPDASYQTVWESTRTLTSHYTPIVCVDGHLYGVHTNDKSLRCVDLATGEVLWRSRTKLARSTQIAVGDRLVVVGEKGHLGLVDLNPDELVEHEITTESLFPGESLYSAPAYVDGRLYLRSDKQAVCLDLASE